MGSRKKTSDDHEVSLSLSVIQAVESTQREPKYYETSRNGKRKRIYEAVKPIHNFHMEYQLTPGPQSPVYQTDIVAYDIVAKVFSEHDERVVNVWQEKGLTYYGWKHSHKLNVTIDSLLALYHHTLTVRVWNTVNKLSPRARFDRPKAFRLPAPKKAGEGVEPQDSDGLLSGGQKPAHLPTVFHDTIPHIQSRRNSRRPSQNIECIEEGHEFTEKPNPIRRTLKIPTLIEEEAEYKEGVEPNNGELEDKLSRSAPENSLRGIKQELTMSHMLPHDHLSTPTPGLKGISRRKLRQLQAEAEESLRIDKQGLVVLSLKVADLFANRDSISAKVNEAVVNIKDLEVSLCLDTPLMSEEQRRRLNPVEFTVGVASGLPEPETNYKPAFVKYQFYDKPPVCTPPLRTLHPSRGHTTVLLLGTIEAELLLEYLRGPPLAIEVHDRDKWVESQEGEPAEGAIFGSLWSDPLLGTCTYTKEVLKQSSQLCREPVGVAHLDLSTLLDGLKTIEYTLPIMNDKRGQLDSLMMSCDYLRRGSQLMVRIKLSYPLEFTSLLTTDKNEIPSQAISTLRPLTPFGHLILILSNQSNELINKVLTLVKGINSSVLGLESLPSETRDAALSTYKLTQEEMNSASCNVITGFHADDGERHYVVCEGLMEGGIRQLWDTLPHHNTQDPGVIKVFYNSDYTFSSRLYGNLDVDLVHIKLPLPLSEIVQQPLIYIRDNLPKLCFTGLMKINELQLCSGFSDVVRSDSLPSPLMIMALSMFCLQHQQIAEYSGLDIEDSQVKETEPLSQTATTVRRRRNSWEPLDRDNKRYESLLVDRKRRPVKDFIMNNIVLANILSEESVRKKNELKRGRLHFRSYSEDNKGAVHVYSSQTYNSTVLGKEVLLGQLNPKNRYTYSQQYHSMTIEPRKCEEERQDLDGKKSSEKFVYPVLKSSLDSNVHPRRPHVARIEELREPFIDNQLHVNKLEPTVNWDEISWNKRETDFERYHPPPLYYGVKQPVTIHLAGDSRQRELEEQEEKERGMWQDKLVVDDTCFHVLRRGIKTEHRHKGPQASTQTDKVKGLLKDEPKKVSFRPNERLRVDNLPALSLIHKGDDSLSDEGGPSTIVGYHPGPSTEKGLKRDRNVIPIFKPSKPPKHLHRKEFVLYCGDGSLS